MAEFSMECGRGKVSENCKLLYFHYPVLTPLHFAMQLQFENTFGTIRPSYGLVEQEENTIRIKIKTTGTVKTIGESSSRIGISWPMNE